MDKVQKIREEVARIQLYTQSELLKQVLDYIDEVQKEPVSERFAFKAIPRLLEMIEPTDRAKAYIAKLADTLEVEGYSTDAKIVRACLKRMNGEKVPIATMNEEPVSEGLESFAKREADLFAEREYECDSYDRGFLSKGFYWGCKQGAKWQKKKTLKESEDAIQYVKENHSPSEVSDFQNAMNISVMKAFDAGKEKMREQMMAKAFDAEVLENYDGKVIEYDETILDKKLSNYKVFDKVKVIVVKEEKL